MNTPPIDISEELHLMGPGGLLHWMTTDPKFKSALAPGTWYLLRAAHIHQVENPPGDPALNREPKELCEEPQKPDDNANTVAPDGAK